MGKLTKQKHHVAVAFIGGLAGLAGTAYSVRDKLRQDLPGGG